MRLRLGSRVLAVFATWLFAASALAQLAPTGPSFGSPAVPEVRFSTSVVQDLLVRGQQLESQRRWGEALSHYESAVRTYPQARELADRLAISRVRYDLSRRYIDSTFRESLTALTSEQALDLYAEVLLKVQAHYVDAPNWTQLVATGRQGFDLALTDPVFLEHNIPAVAPAQVDYCRRNFPAWQPLTTIDSRYTARSFVATAARMAREQLGVSEQAVVMEYMCGMTTALDPYSAYLTAGQLNEVYSQIEGNFVGLGVELKAADGALAIVKVITGSPAAQGGVRAGDRIVAVDGRATDNLSTDQAASLLQGVEGSMVDVTLVTQGYAPRTVRLRRSQVEVPSVDDAKMVDQAAGVAYLKMTCFQKTTSRDLDAALWQLHRQGMRSLIIDLRGNPGGLLTTSVEVADKFIDRGLIVRTRGRSKQEDFDYSAHSQGTWRVPLVVLIDGDSASASEIFAGAIRDHGRGVIVGERSYGKGSVQGIFPLNLASSGLRLTTAKFYSPKLLPYSGVGVEPNVPVVTAAKPVMEGMVAAPTPDQDAAFEAAVTVARNKVARR